MVNAIKRQKGPRSQHCWVYHSRRERLVDQIEDSVWTANERSMDIQSALELRSCPYKLGTFRYPVDLIAEESQRDRDAKESNGHREFRQQ